MEREKKSAKGLRALFMEEHLESWTPEGAGRMLWKSEHPGFWKKSTSFASECHRSHEAAQNTCVFVFPDHRKEHSSTRDAEHATHSLVINPYVFASVSKLNVLM